MFKNLLIKFYFAILQLPEQKQGLFLKGPSYSSPYSLYDLILTLLCSGESVKLMPMLMLTPTFCMDMGATLHTPTITCLTSMDTMLILGLGVKTT